MQFVKKTYYAVNEPLYLTNTSTTVTDDLTSSVLNSSGNNVPTGSPAANFRKRVILPFASAVRSDHSLQVCPSASADVWLDVANVFPHIKMVDTSEYGIWVDRVDSLTIDIYFGENGATPDLTWTAANTAGWRWRYEKINSDATVSLPSSMFESEFFNYGTVTTTTAVEASALDYTVSTNTTALLRAQVTARKDGTTSNVYSLQYMAENNAGTTTVTLMSKIETEDDTTWDAKIDASGALARVRVTGAGSTTIVWSVILETTILN